ncbi:histidine kinase [Dyadobacter sp. CY327]|uniref:sensor histidine kinase n=1 Tax=Dyadobacter sp. CY327 TaxID=2907301 RepID=UPI001F380040|nr:histidine kinase [Dyadobacter sp. CY327]MCE7069134.1 histidine kinase [Dyadobacter sp. CY327]
MMRIRFRYFDKYFDTLRKNRLNFFILVLVIPWLVPVVGYLMWGSIYFSDLRVFLGGSFINLILCLIANHINQIIAIIIAKIYPDTHQSVFRVVFWFVLYSIVNVCILMAVLLAYDQIHLFGFSIQRERAMWSVFLLLAASLIGAGLTELAYTFMQWKTNQDELQQMEQRQLLSELEVVKQQVNPHFLFNCLNSLSVLISESPATAEKFVDEMSKVYRYLLSVNGPDRETSMVTLDAELRYIRSYIYLLETRFENGISISIQAADLYLNGQMAPLTLQTLIDNAIRHNIVSADHPLRIAIRTTATGQLEVVNNLQKRTVRTPFSNAGLATLISRYKMLFNQAGTIQIKEEGSEFTVLLPLIYT